MRTFKNVDEYIAVAPKDIQGRLKEIRKAIKKVAPKAEEKISYGMPYYGYKGRLVYFGFFKNHIGLFIPGSVFEDHKSDLQGYQTAKATVRFPHDQKLPLALIKKLVKARIKQNDKYDAE